MPDAQEITNCSSWLEAEFELLRPELVLAVGKLAISRFIEFQKLTEVIGTIHQTKKFGYEFDLLPLPHPSGASTWHRMEPGKTLLTEALELFSKHPAMKQLLL